MTSRIPLAAHFSSATSIFHCDERLSDFERSDVPTPAIHGHRHLVVCQALLLHSSPLVHPVSSLFSPLFGGWRIARTGVPTSAFQRYPDVQHRNDITTAHDPRRLFIYSISLYLSYRRLRPDGRRTYCQHRPLLPACGENHSPAYPGMVVKEVRFFPVSRTVTTRVDCFGIGWLQMGMPIMPQGTPGQRLYPCWWVLSCFLYDATMLTLSQTVNSFSYPRRDGQSHSASTADWSARKGLLM